jgi:hypothetical protein
MRSVGTVLAATCLAGISACASGGDPDVFAVDPGQRGFELPQHPIVLFYVDGLRADVLEEVAREGRLPRLSRLFLDRAAHVRSAVVSVPSVTYANAVTMLTGCAPSTHGVWSNQCFDPVRLLTRNYEDERDLAADDDGCPSIFELLHDEVTAGVALPFERGVELSRARTASTGGVAFGVEWAMGRKEQADERLSEQMYTIGEEVRRLGRWPTLLAVHLPAVDNIGHEQGSDSPAYRDAVANLDDAIGEVLDAFEKGEMLDQLTLVLTSDHGHHPAPLALELGPYLETLLGMPVLVAAENDGDEKPEARRERYQAAHAIVTPSGMRVATIHLRTGESWSERPPLDAILGFRTGGAADPAGTLPEALARSPAIQLVALRAGEGQVRVYGHDGSAEIRSTRVGAGEPYFAYQVLAGSDPLGYDAGGLRDWMRSAHTSREWLQATAALAIPDLVPQIVTALASPCSGDLVLFAAPGWDFSEEHYVGGHGGITREEMLVPLYVAGPGIRAGAEIPAARLVDLVPTLLEIAGVPLASPPHFDGESFAKELR